MDIRIRNYHLDGYGHVNHARYLEFLEEARWALFDQRDLLRFLEGIQLVVARIDIRYRRAAVSGNVLRIENRVKELTARHLVLTQTIVLAESGKTAAEADVTLMPVAAATGRSMKFPESLLTPLNKLLL
ncbi:acyl-CoA thioesterase [Neisseria chenwenguii]|uniref:acyl-CoA thioesterase n=1 Tax=Neisseria chenwenguii TaxID=1853278 RepID=UPI000F4FC2EE|nr:thioesterase family protein [Neisseria chenwenguii]ROV55538.1 acyl-CoA thioesterase [Neisseria chenwenguii]